MELKQIVENLYGMRCVTCSQCRVSEVETEVVHIYRHDENNEARSQTRALTTLRLTYSHSHYSDEQNKEMHTVLFTLPRVTHTVDTRTNQTDMTMPNLRTKP